MEIVLRLLIACLIAAAGVVLFRLFNRLLLARLRARRLGLESLIPGVPAVVYFTTPTCVPCKTIQRPALAQLKSALGDGVQIIEVDCTLRPDLADSWGVLSVPTTFIIDARGRPRRVNHGVARAEELLNQIMGVGKRVNG